MDEIRWTSAIGAKCIEEETDYLLPVDKLLLFYMLCRHCDIIVNLENSEQSGNSCTIADDNNFFNGTG